MEFSDEDQQIVHARLEFNLDKWASRRHRATFAQAEIMRCEGAVIETLKALASQVQKLCGREDEAYMSNIWVLSIIEPMLVEVEKYE
jgi:hypothetical protein